MRDPFILTACPRSGTSLSMSLLKASGAFLGEICGKTRWNPFGQFENTELVSNIQKPYLRSIGADPKGQKPLPDTLNIPLDPDRREKTLDLFKRQGLKEGQVWGWKGCKACLDWPCWNHAFPEATWIIVRRKYEEIAKSCLRVSFMDRYAKFDGWMMWVQEHKKRFEQIKKNCANVFEFWSNDLIEGNLEVIKPVIEFLGLPWKEEKLRNLIHPEAWNSKK